MVNFYGRYAWEIRILFEFLKVFFAALFVWIVLLYAVSFTHKCIVQKKILKLFAFWTAALSVVLILVFTTINSDFVKMRKKVDVKWLHGKTLEEVSERYYNKDDVEYDYDGRIRCAMELYQDDWLDHMKFYTRYYAELDDNGKIVKVVYVHDN